MFWRAARFWHLGNALDTLHTSLVAYIVKQVPACSIWNLELLLTVDEPLIPTSILVRFPFYYYNVNMFVINKFYRVDK